MSPRTKRALLLFSCALAIAAAALMLWLWSRQQPSAGHDLSCADIQERLAKLDPTSAEAQFLQELSTCQTENQPAAPRLVEFNDLGVHFSYPSQYEERQPTGTQQDDRRIFTTRGSDTRRLAIMRQPFTDPLEEFSAIRARRLKPDVYRETTKRLNGRQALEFTKQDADFEKLLVFHDGETIITVALTAAVPMGAEQAAQDYEQILDSLVIRGDY